MSAAKKTDSDCCDRSGRSPIEKPTALDLSEGEASDSRYANEACCPRSARKVGRSGTTDVGVFGEPTFHDRSWCCRPALSQSSSGAPNLTPSTWAARSRSQTSYSFGTTRPAKRSRTSPIALSRAAGSGIGRCDWIWYRFRLPSFVLTR